MFYDRFLYLCKLKAVSPSRAAVEAGISKSLVTKWRTNKVETPSPDVIKKLARYFNLSVSELLEEDVQKEKAPTAEGERSVSDAELKFALWGDCDKRTRYCSQTSIWCFRNRLFNKAFTALIKMQVMPLFMTQKPKEETILIWLNALEIVGPILTHR